MAAEVSGTLANPIPSMRRSRLLGQAYKRDYSLDGCDIVGSPYAICLPQMRGSEMRMKLLDLSDYCFCFSQLTGTVRVANQYEQSPKICRLENEHLLANSEPCSYRPRK